MRLNPASCWNHYKDARPIENAMIDSAKDVPYILIKWR